MDTNMKAPLCAKAVETVVKVYSGLRGSIFYSDRSSQCTSWLYRRTIQKTGLIQSMNNAQRALSWQFTLREHVNRNEGGAILYRLDSWKISVEQLKEMVWWYFYSNWNNHHNHRICSTNGRLPSMVKRTVLILFTATKRIKKTCVFCVNHYWQFQAARVGKSVCKTRSRRRNFCDQQGIGECPNKPLLAKWIARSIACRYTVTDEIKYFIKDGVRLCRPWKHCNIELSYGAESGKIAC